ncbi:MAG: porin family protein [Acidobacteria bacterium]|nr:porin family protein [Acidobacteriota bacterium]
MKHVFLIFGALLMLSSATLAQGGKPVSFFAGYSNLQAEGRFDPDNPTQNFNDDFFERRRGAHGVNLAIAGYPTKVFGIKGDFSFHRNDDDTDFATGRNSVETQVYYFMGGPIVKFRNRGRVEPFVHALAGGAHTRFVVDSQNTVANVTTRRTVEANSTDFAAAIGGGVDVRVCDRFSIRAIQVDYAPIFLRDRSISVLGTAGALQPFTLEGQRQDNIRISVGIVF